MCNDDFHSLINVIALQLEGCESLITATRTLIAAKLVQSIDIGKQ